MLAFVTGASSGIGREMAKVLGEITADTVKHYGLRWPGSKRPQFTVALQKSSLQTARPVRAASRTGIEQAQASKYAKRNPVMGKADRQP